VYTAPDAIPGGGDTVTGSAASTSPGAPIGIFDSGLGGLSVLREIIARLPTRDIVYVADSRYVPYGPKSPDFIRERALAIAAFLIEQQHVAVVVVACNTATTHAVDAMRARFPDTPIVGMEPAIKPAAAVTQTGVVGVLATEATLGGQRFTSLVQRHSEGVEVLTQPSPGLVEQVEAGDLSSEETRRLLRQYTQPMLEQGADTIVLGCTHYPFLADTLRQVVGRGVTLIDTGAAVANQVARVTPPAASPAAPPVGASADASGEAASRTVRITCYTSGDPESARPVIVRLLGRPVSEVLPLPV